MWNCTWGFALSLYGLTVFKNISGPHADKIRKGFHQLFTANGLSLETECNLEIINYLDITSDFSTGNYKLHCKPNDETIYIRPKSNYPANIMK